MFSFSLTAIVLCSPLTREYLINYARSLIYTTALPLPSLVSTRTAYELLQDGSCIPVFIYHHPVSSLLHSRRLQTWKSMLTQLKLQSHLQYIIQHFQSQLEQLLQECHQPGNANPLLRLEADHDPQSPIFALLTPYPRELAAFCQRSLFVVRPIVPPTVPAGGERVRVCLHAGNTIEEIDGFVDLVAKWMRELKTSKTAKL